MTHGEGEEHELIDADHPGGAAGGRRCGLPASRKHQEAVAAVQNIQDQLDALDPATRAEVIARLTSDEVKRVRRNQP